MVGLAFSSFFWVFLFYILGATSIFLVQFGCKSPKKISLVSMIWLLFVLLGIGSAHIYDSQQEL
jgi:hypothetical protein